MWKGHLLCLLQHAFRTSEPAQRSAPREGGPPSTGGGPEGSWPRAPGAAGPGDATSRVALGGSVSPLGGRTEVLTHLWGLGFLTSPDLGFCTLSLGEGRIADPGDCGRAGGRAPRPREAGRQAGWRGTATDSSSAHLGSGGLAGSRALPPSWPWPLPSLGPVHPDGLLALAPAVFAESGVPGCQVLRSPYTRLPPKPVLPRTGGGAVLHRGN